MSDLSIYLDEMNMPSVGYSFDDWDSKGFLSKVRFQDFPIRGKTAFLCIRRRRWEVISNKEIISRDWKLVQSGTRMTKEFAAFSKEHLDKYPVSCVHLREYFQLDGKLLQQQYKEHISDNRSWE